MAQGEKKVRVAVVGIGHFGRLHAETYRRIPGVELVAVVDRDERRVREAAAAWNIAGFTDHRELAGKVDAASVAVPTENHPAVGRDLLKAGIAILMEKPMAGTVAEAEDLLREARQAGVLMQVGHLERFNPALVAIENHVRDPRFIECHRISPFKFRAVDVGVVLDVMIHDLDIVLHIARSEVKSVEAMGVGVLSEKEDLVNARIVFESGCVANLTASRISMNTMRKVRVFQKDCYISLDCLNKGAMVYRKSDKFKGLDDLLSKARAPGSDLEKLLFSELLDVKKLNVGNTPPLEAELASFVKCVAEGTQPMVTGEDGCRAVAVAHMITDSIKLRLS